MIEGGKKNLLGVLIDAVDYEAAVGRVVAAAKEGRGLGVSALAVHGVMTGVGDAEHRARLNRLELVVPDGQPVRWALNLLHRAALPDRVYGPRLMQEICAAAEREGLPVYLYGSRPEVLQALVASLQRRYPRLVLAGYAPSRFRTLTPEERDELARAIRGSGARIAFVGLGCPRQEVFAYEMRERLGMPLVAVGAAFDFHAGLAKEPPAYVQRAGLQWLHRLAQDPKRLWRRYVLLNPAFLGLLLLQWSGLWRPDPLRGTRPPREVRFG